jgi:hypothetical protein
MGFWARNNKEKDIINNKAWERTFQIAKETESSISHNF